MDITFRPGPAIVMLCRTTSGALVNVIVPVAANVIVSPDRAWKTASRSDPAPLSAVLVTVNVVASAGQAPAMTKRIPPNTLVSARRITGRARQQHLRGKRQRA